MEDDDAATVVITADDRTAKPTTNNDGIGNILLLSVSFDIGKKSHKYS